MSWDQLESILDRQADQQSRGDRFTAPADGSPPVNCPVCFTRLRFRRCGSGLIGDCPLGDFRWPAA